MFSCFEHVFIHVFVAAFQLFRSYFSLVSYTFSTPSHSFHFFPYFFATDVLLCFMIIMASYVDLLQCIFRGHGACRLLLKSGLLLVRSFSCPSLTIFPTCFLPFSIHSFYFYQDKFLFQWFSVYFYPFILFLFSFSLLEGGVIASKGLLSNWGDYLV